MRQLADIIEEKFPDVWKLLVKLRYVDDFGKSCKNADEAKKLIDNTETVLDTVQMKVKEHARTFPFKKQFAKIEFIFLKIFCYSKTSL